MLLLRSNNSSIIHLLCTCLVDLIWPFPFACHQHGISRPTKHDFAFLSLSALYRIALHYLLASPTSATISYGFHLMLQTCTNSIEPRASSNRLFSGVPLVQRNDATR